MENTGTFDKNEVRVQMEPKKRLLLFIAIFIQMAAQQFMTNGLSTAAPTMLMALNGMALFGLVFCFANMATAAINPIAGKLCNLFNKRNLLIIGSIFNMIEYLGCGFSPNMGFLLMTRIVGGLGTGLLYVVGLSMVADMFPANERPKYMGIQASCGALASCIGPVVAGLFCDYSSWRFFPIVAGVFGVISFILIVALAPNISLKSDNVKADIIGTITLAIVLVLMVLVLVLSGQYFQWTDPVCIAMIIILFAALIIFIIDQRKQGENAIIPGSYMKNRFVLVAVTGAFLASLGAVAVNSYIATYAQTVMGVSATVSALPMTIGNIITIFGATIVGTILAKKGCYKLMACLGPIFFAILLFMCASLTANTSTAFFTVGLGVMFGLGGSICQVINLSIIQRFLPASKMGVASGIVQTSQMVASVASMGGLSAVMNNMNNSAAAFITVFAGAGILVLIQIVIVLVRFRNFEKEAA